MLSMSAPSIGSTYIGITGERQQFTFERLLAHELLHTIFTGRDVPDVAQELADPQGDLTGPVVPIVNRVFPEEVARINASNSAVGSLSLSFPAGAISVEEQQVLNIIVSPHRLMDRLV